LSFTGIVSGPIGEVNRTDFDLERDSRIDLHKNDAVAVITTAAASLRA